MYKIQYDNSNQYQGNEKWFDTVEFDTYEKAEECLLIRDYVHLEDNLYQELYEYCPLMARIIKVI